MPKPKLTRYGAPIGSQPPEKPRPVQILSCPVCDSLLGEQSVVEHLEAHRPAAHNCEKHEEWRLDLDGVINYRPEGSVFYCRPCGRYASESMMTSSERHG